MFARSHRAVFHTARCLYQSRRAFTISRPIRQSINQSINQSASQSTKPVKQSVNLPSPDAVRIALRHCVQQVKEHDQSVYVSTLFSPPINQSISFALHALRIELIKIRKQSSNDGRIAAMKYAWWTNNIRSLFNQSTSQSVDQPAAHPILTVLTALLAQRSQTINQSLNQSSSQSTNQAMLQRYLIRLIDSQEDLLEMMQPPSQSHNPSDNRIQSVNQLDSLFESTDSTIFYLIGQFSLTDRSINQSAMDHIFSHIGKAIGMVNFLQSLPGQPITQSVLIPLELIDAHNLNQSPDQSDQSINQADYQALVFDLAKTAKEHIHHARDLFEQEFNQPVNESIKQSTQQVNDILSSTKSSTSQPSDQLKQAIKKQVASVCLPVVTADRWLDQLEDLNFDLNQLIETGHHRYRLEPLKLRWALWKHAKNSTF